MKPVELNTVEEDQETQKTTYPGLQMAQRALEDAQAEQKRYADAISHILAAYNHRVREVARLREQLRQKATQKALDGKLSDFEEELSDGCSRIVTMLEEIERLGYAQQRLETRQVQNDREVTSCSDEVSKMKDYSNSYEQAKREYTDLYREAAAFEATREKFSAEGPPGATRMLILKKQLESQAAFLGCHGDLSAFLKNLEAEGRP